jgi:type IV secretory pathway VirB10-like protein
MLDELGPVDWVPHIRLTCSRHLACGAFDGGEEMYIRTQKQSKRTQAFGIVSAVAITEGGGLLLNSMNVERDRIEQTRTELVMIEPPPPPPIEIPEPPKVDVVEEVEAPPAPPPLVAPEIDFVPEEIPEITAPVADPVILPDPVPVAPNPAPAMQRCASAPAAVSRRLRSRAQADRNAWTMLQPSGSAASGSSRRKSTASPATCVATASTTSGACATPDRDRCSLLEEPPADRAGGIFLAR